MYPIFKVIRHVGLKVCVQTCEAGLKVCMQTCETRLKVWMQTCEGRLKVCAKTCEAGLKVCKQICALGYARKHLQAKWLCKFTFKLARGVESLPAHLQGRLKVCIKTCEAGLKVCVQTFVES